MTKYGYGLERKSECSQLEGKSRDFFREARFQKIVGFLGKLWS